MSFVFPEGADWTRQILTNFCHRVFFFRDGDAGRGWAQHHDGAFLLTVAEAFQAAEHKVRYEYGNDTDGA